MPAITSGALADVQKRLGSKATLADPDRGLTTGHAVADHAAQLAADVAGAAYTEERAVVGNERDVALGVVRWPDGRARRVAVVSVRKKSREIDVRVYYAPSGADAPARLELLPADMRLTLARPVGVVLDALAENDVDEALSQFEETAAVHDAAGGVHPKASGAMRTWLAGLAAGGFDCEPAGSADDGRVCVVEANFAKGGARRPGLYVFERGDSGLFTSLATYP